MLTVSSACTFSRQHSRQSISSIGLCCRGGCVIEHDLWRIEGLWIPLHITSCISVNELPSSSIVSMVSLCNEDCYYFTHCSFKNDDPLDCFHRRHHTPSGERQLCVMIPGCAVVQLVFPVPLPVTPDRECSVVVKSGSPHDIREHQAPSSATVSQNPLPSPLFAFLCTPSLI
ncbi:hypothetical protein L218DRAFT_175181 [Marasmius fiardii PR-910]|nr:hypothetical protein L218DRAFT_175181 [Marasmius fiardii PR-910]